MDFMNKNALVVLNYNDADTTLSYVKSLSDISSLNHIVVVDNMSSDNSYERLLEVRSERITVIQTDHNGGYAYGNNYGCKYAIEHYNPEILFISNPDVRFDNTTIERMQKCLQDSDDNKVAVVAPIVNQGYNTWHLLGYWGVIQSIFLVCFNLEKRRIKKFLVSSKSIGVYPVGVVEGSFFAVRADAFKSVNGFDERTFLYYEENILARRLYNSGYCEAILTNCRYDHFHSISVSKHFGSKAKAFLNFHRGMTLYLGEYMNTGLIGMLFFEVCFVLGYLERLIYDLFGGYELSRKIGKTEAKVGADE